MLNHQILSEGQNIRTVFYCRRFLKVTTVVCYSVTSEDFVERATSYFMQKYQIELFPVENLAEPDVMYFANSRKMTTDSS